MHCMCLLKQTKYFNENRAMWRLHKEDKKLTNQGMESHYSETLPKALETPAWPVAFIQTWQTFDEISRERKNFETRLLFLNGNYLCFILLKRYTGLPLVA